MIGVTLFAIFIVLMILGVPIGVALGIGGVVAIALSNLDTQMYGLLAAPTNLYASLTKYPLLALPMFVLVGSIFDRSGVAQRLVDSGLPLEDWIAVGRCIRRFHDFGLCHADLNAHNVMFDGAGAVWLIDFDRGRLRRAGLWRDANLVRLRRSLLVPSGWSSLRCGTPDGVRIAGHDRGEASGSSVQAMRTDGLRKL